MKVACLLITLAATSAGCIVDSGSCPDGPAAKIAAGSYVSDASNTTASVTRVEVDGAGKVLVHVRASDGSTRIDTYRVKARREEMY